MFLAQSLAAAIIVTVITSQAGQPDEAQPGEAVPQTGLIEISFEHLVAADTEDCNEANLRKSPPADFRIEALEKSAPADEDDGSGFCASASGPATGGQDCHFQLLA